MPVTVHDKEPTILDTYAAHFTTTPGYLDFARFGPPSTDVLDAVNQVTRQAMSGNPDHAEAVIDAPEQTRRLVAELLTLPVEQVTLTPNTSTALFQAAYAMPEGVVLAPERDFPSNIRPWQRAAERGGPQLRLVASTTAAVALAEELDSSVTAVTVSAVDYRTGERADLATLREVVGDRLLIVDAIQGFGVVEADWACADVIAVGGQKWLRAGWGCGFMACSTGALERLGHGLSGWTGVANPLLEGPEQPPVATADRFTITNPSPQAAAGLSAALRIVQEVTVPVIQEAVRARVVVLGEVLQRHGAELLGSTDPDRGSGIISARFRHSRPSPAQIAASFARAGIVATQREDYLRVSVHASTPLDVADRIDAALDEARRDR